MLMSIIPALGVILFIGFEMKHEFRKGFFKIPTWMSSSIIAYIIGTVVGGVTGGITMFMTELILFPAFCIMKFVTTKKEEKKRNHRKKKKKKHKNL